LLSGPPRKRARGSVPSGGDEATGNAAMNRYTQAHCTAVVTGAASGLGKGLADAYAARGLRVVYADIDRAGAQAAALAAGARCEAVVIDVADAAACSALIDGVVARHGRIDLLFNCAGFAFAAEVQHTEPDDWRRLVDVNLMGSVQCAVRAYRHMVRQGGGQIATIASLAGLLPMPVSAGYATTKAGLVNFSHSLRAEGAGLGVQVCVICPGFVETRIFDNAQYRELDQATLRRYVKVPFMAVDDAVRRIVRGVDANRATLVFPWHARLAWWIQRLLPGLIRAGLVLGMARIRARPR
jgi:NAD(P)-dependent dehydrogenase (short-subunit alcohol dehydrogenase family)